MAHPSKPAPPAEQPSPLGADTLHKALQAKVLVANFSPEIFADAERLYELCKGGTTRELLYLRSMILVAAIRDYRGFSTGADAVAAGKELRDELRYRDFSDNVTPRVAREQIRFVAYYARMHFYRNKGGPQPYEEAAQIYRECLGYADRRATREHPLWGTKAELSYFAGCAARQLGDLDAAVRHYDAAIRHYYKRATWHTDPTNEHAATTEEEIRAEWAFAAHRTALVIGLGLGWCHYHSGALWHALDHFVGPAQLTLRTTNDRIHADYLSMIRGSILRSLAGRQALTSPSQGMALIREAINEVKRAWDLMAEGPYKHPYATRAAAQLAQCHMRKFMMDGDIAGLDAAEQSITEMEKRATSALWQCNAAVLRSRVARHRGELAKKVTGTPGAVKLFTVAADHAKRALKLIGDATNEPLGRFDAYTSYGEALLALDKPAAAREQFEEAQKTLEASRRRSMQGSGDRSDPLANPKLLAILWTHIARTYVREKNRVDALTYIERAKQAVAHVEHQFVIDALYEVETELNQLKQEHFIISHDRPSLDYEALRSELQAWLIQQARGQNLVKLADIAKLLHVSVPTVARWMEEVNQKK